MRFRPFRRRPLRALQVEVTSRCTRSCAVCPRSLTGLEWRQGDLDQASWNVLREDLGLARHVQLQGWGEPLLHPRLPRMVDAARAAGARVGLTTNGDLLGEAADWIADRGVDVVTVSVAGDQATHAALRAGSRLQEVWDAVGRLAARRGRRRRPRIQISHLLTLDGAEDLPGVVETAAEAGADEVFAIHLDATPTRELYERAAFGPSGLRAEAGEAMAAAERAARSRRIVFRGAPSMAQDLLVCAHDPLRMVFVGWDGRVGPCVNLLLPLAGPIPRWTEKGPGFVEPVVYGRLGDATLREILEGEERRRFKAPFAARLAAEGRFLAEIGALGAAEAWSRLDEADRLREEELAAHPFPARCEGCHKALGW